MFRDFFSFDSWRTMSNIYTGAFFYTLIVLLVLAAINWRSFKNNVSTRVLIIAFTFTFLLQTSIYFCVRYERRYLAFAILLAIPLAVPGFIKLAELISKNVKFIDLKKAFILLIIIAVAISAVKTLNPEKGKIWLHEVSNDIKLLCPPSKKPVILTCSTDERISYYANAVYIRFTLGGHTENIRYMLSDNKIMEIPLLVEREKPFIFTFRGSGEHTGTFIALDIPQGIEHFNENIKRFGYDNIFILVPDFDRNFKKFFTDAGIDKLEFTLVKEYFYKRSKDVVFSLYKVNNKPRNKNDASMTDIK